LASRLIPTFPFAPDDDSHNKSRHEDYTRATVEVMPKQIRSRRSPTATCQPLIRSGEVLRIHSKAASHSHENRKPAALPLLLNNAELKSYSIIEAVGLEVKTWEKPSKSSQLDERLPL
jgi:hypothetical protein